MTQRVLTKRQIKFCDLVMKLDRIPRYGRLYYFDKNNKRQVIWKYQPRGRWGWSILKRLDLFWPYIDYCTPPIEEGELITESPPWQSRDLYFVPGWDK